MANVKMKWYGFNVMLNQAEACGWTKGTGGSRSVGSIAADLAAIGVAGFTNVYAGIAAAAIVTCSGYIRDLTELSGGKGVRLKFVWPGVYAGCSRRGSGNSPCPK